MNNLHIPDAFFRENIEQGDGIFDRQSFDLCSKWFSGGTALDVGAHYGTWCRGLSSHFDRVVGFEPVADNFNVALKNTEGLANVEVLNVAASDKGRRVDMQNDGDNTGQYAVAHDGKVTAVSIDSMDIEGVGFIKIDVEGYEYYVLKGAEKTINRDMPILCVELNGLSSRYKCFDSSIIKMLYDWGYILLGINNKDYVFGDLCKLEN